MIFVRISFNGLMKNCRLFMCFYKELIKKSGEICECDIFFVTLQSQILVTMTNQPIDAICMRYGVRNVWRRMVGGLE